MSAVAVLAARESRRKERTASLSHLITRDDMTVVFISANRRLTECADALRTLDVAVGRAIHTQRCSSDSVIGVRMVELWA